MYSLYIWDVHSAYFDLMTPLGSRNEKSQRNTMPVVDSNLDRNRSSWSWSIIIIIKIVFSVFSDLFSTRSLFTSLYTSYEKRSTIISVVMRSRWLFDLYSNCFINISRLLYYRRRDKSCLFFNRRITRDKILVVNVKHSYKVKKFPNSLAEYNRSIYGKQKFHQIKWTLTSNKHSTLSRRKNSCGILGERTFIDKARSANRMWKRRETHQKKKKQRKGRRREETMKKADSDRQ